MTIRRQWDTAGESLQEGNVGGAASRFLWGWGIFAWG